ncbi:MAG: hypothetical protein V4751_04105 [Pseudomonadota bacterium]
MNKITLTASALALVCCTSIISAQNNSMSFFITSVGSGNGANLGGLDGADAHCAALATAAGSSGKTWRAYLSTQGAGAVNARDRIGTGPWFNAKGVQIAANVAELHSEAALTGKENSLTEAGNTVNGRGDEPNQHDILTGSQADGTTFTDGADHTCNNWTSSSEGTAAVGHFDRQGGGANPTSWNSAHSSRSCSQEDLIATGGNGYFYCFATD